MFDLTFEDFLEFYYLVFIEIVSLIVMVILGAVGITLLNYSIILGIITLLLGIFFAFLFIGTIIYYVKRGRK